MRRCWKRRSRSKPRSRRSRRPFAKRSVGSCAELRAATSASLGTLVFKADIGMKDAGFADPKIAERPKDGLIVVTCALGGQAKLGAKVLVDYGFTNVKVVEGGCVAWKGAGI